MSFFTSFQELLDFDQSTNLNGFHFSNSLFGFDSNSVPPLENLPPPVPLDQVNVPQSNTRASLTTPSPIPELIPLSDTIKQCQPGEPQVQQHQNQLQTTQSVSHNLQQTHHQRNLQSPTMNPPQPATAPVVSKFQLKVTPNNEIYISNESGSFCELAGSIVPSAEEEKTFVDPLPPIVKHTEPVQIQEITPPKTLFCIEKGIKRPLSPSNGRYCNSGIFRSSQGVDIASPKLKKKTTSITSNGITGGSGTEAKLVVSNVINNGLIVNKKHLSNNEEDHRPSASASSRSTPERRIMRPKKRKKKPLAALAKATLEAKIEPINGRLITRVAPEPVVSRSTAFVTPLMKSTQELINRRPTSVHQDNLRAHVPMKSTAAAMTNGSANVDNSALNFSGIKEKAAQEAIFIERVNKQQQQQQQQQPLTPSLRPQQQQQQQQLHSSKTTQIKNVPGKTISTKTTAPVVTDNTVAVEESGSNTAPVELKVVADLVMDKNVFGHISLLNDSKDRSKTVIYQNPVTSTNVIYSILNPKTLNLSLGGVSRGTTATLTLEPHRGGRKPKKRGRKKKIVPENGMAVEGKASTALLINTTDPAPIDPSIPVSVTRSGRLSKPPRYANSFFQNMKQKIEHSPPPPPPPPPPPVPRLELPGPDPETAEKLPNFSAALNSTVNQSESDIKRKVRIPLQYRCATCKKIYLGKRMQRHLQKYPNHNSERDCLGTDREKKKQEEKSTYLYKHLFDRLQKFTEKDKGRIMLKEISNFVDFVRALIPKLITNDEQNSTVEYIDHNVADVLRLNHGKYRLKLSSLAEEYEKLNLTVNLLNNNGNCVVNTHHNSSIAPHVTSTPNGTTERQAFSFNADDLLNQSSSFPSLTTLMHEHNLLVQPNGGCTHNNNNNNSNNNIHNNSHNHPNNNHYLPSQYHNSHYNNNHNHHFPLIGSTCHDDAMNSLSGLCKSPVQHSTSGMVNMALNLY